MKVRHACAALALASVAILGGCRQSGDVAASPTNGPVPAGPRVERRGKGPYLGTALSAGPFRVELSSRPSVPKMGTVTFTADVTRGGTPVRDASVTLALSMVDMGGPKLTLRPTGGHYEGAAVLTMGGDWDGKVTVKARGASGSALYRFWADPL